MLFGDMMVLLKAVGAYEHQKKSDQQSVCTRYGLRAKAMIDITKIRRQLIQIGKTRRRSNERKYLFLFTGNAKNICLLTLIVSLSLFPDVFLFFSPVKSIVPSTASMLDAPILPPTEHQLFLLRKVLAAGMVDRLAK